MNDRFENGIIATIFGMGCIAFIVQIALYVAIIWGIIYALTHLL